VRMDDKDGMLPLHLAMKTCDTPTEVTMAILEAYKEGAQVKDSSGRLPLHLAVQNKEISMEVLQALLDAHKEGAQVKDRRGFLPLHMAAMGLKTNKGRYYQNPFLYIVFRAYPEADLEPTLPCGVISFYDFDQQRLQSELKDMAKAILADHAALVEFRLCLFVARRTNVHPLRVFGSGYIYQLRQIESFLIPCFGASKAYRPHAVLRLYLYKILGKLTSAQIFRLGVVHEEAQAKVRLARLRGSPARKSPGKSRKK
jgi:hypothetical protein